MFLREVKRQNKNGTQACYLQLVHNEWDPAAQASRTKIVHSFGRTDQVDPAAIERLIASLQRLRGPATASTASAMGEGSELALLDSRPMGGTHLLDGMWRRLGIAEVMAKLLTGRRRDSRTERVLFALVANRALEACSKLAAADWVRNDVHIDGLPDLDEDACYRAMDWLLEIEDELAQQVYWQVATLLDLEVDLLFFDTTSTYFELDEPDTPISRDARGYPAADGERSGPDTAPEAHTADDDDKVGFRTHGKSKDHRPDLPQVVVGMAVTRTGIPIRCWCWPGNTGDSALIRQVRDDLRDWKLSRVVWVGDRGFWGARSLEEILVGYACELWGCGSRRQAVRSTPATSRPCRRWWRVARGRRSRSGPGRRLLDRPGLWRARRGPGRCWLGSGCAPCACRWG